MRIVTVSIGGRRELNWTDNFGECEKQRCVALVCWLFDAPLQFPREHPTKSPGSPVSKVVHSSSL